MNDEILLEMIRSNQRVCDYIYTKIARQSSKDNESFLLDCDLVSSFNDLVDINQKAINRMYPDRNNKIPPVYLKIKITEIQNIDGVDNYQYGIIDYRQDSHEFMHGKVVHE